MLDQANVQRLLREFRLTDQAWTLYAPTLGEPHLLDDVLLYTDDVVTHVCAFPLGNAARELSPSDIERLVELLPTDYLRAINVWGRFTAAPEQLRIRGRVFERRQFADYSPHRVELAIPIDLQTLEKEAAIRRVVSKIRRSALETEVVARPHLSAAHLRLIREMLATHDVIPFDVALILSIPALVRDPDTLLVEVRRERQLKAFAILWLPATDRAVSAWSFSRHEPGARYADAAMEASIRFCAANGKRYLHLGYSETEGIWNFKKKWGATVEGPAYRDAFYAVRDQPLPLAQERWFTWRERLTMWTQQETGRESADQVTPH